MPRRILLGQSDFASLRGDGLLYVDKSMFAHEVVDAPAQVLLYARPRRFGKTLNLSMLQAFFEVGAGRSALFGDLAVWSSPLAMEHFGRHPVIRLSFKDVTLGSWPEARLALVNHLAAEAARHGEALSAAPLPVATRTRLEALVRGELRDPARALLDLCEALHAHHGERVVLLVDEYDAPILNGWERGHYDEAVTFFRALLAPALKDNPSLYKGVLGGVLRVARESMFAGLNNVQAYTLLHRRPTEHFGFDEAEVAALLREFGRSDEIGEVRDWYNGYRFGDTVVYNPWSIVSLLGEPPRTYRPYWLNTSANSLVRSLLLRGVNIGGSVERLLRGEVVTAAVDEDVPLAELRPENAWSLFLFSGYLRAVAVRDEGGRVVADLAVPNREVRGVWAGTFLRWLDERMGPVEPLHRALLAGDAPALQRTLGAMLERHASYHDVASTQDEAFYHAFLLGLLVSLEPTHAVRSNRESGAGRADLLVLPRRAGQPGAVLEFKRATDALRVGALADEALFQIGARGYDAELRAAGAVPVVRLGIAFAGKQVAVRGG